MGKKFDFPVLNKLQEIIGEPIVITLGVDGTGCEIIKIDVVTPDVPKLQQNIEAIEPNEDKMTIEEAREIVKNYEKNMTEQMKTEVGYFG